MDNHKKLNKQLLLFLEIEGLTEEFFKFNKNNEEIEKKEGELKNGSF